MRRILALLATTALAVAACGGGDEGSSDDAADTTTTTVAETAACDDLFEPGERVVDDDVLDASCAGPTGDITRGGRHDCVQGTEFAYVGPWRVNGQRQIEEIQMLGDAVTLDDLDRACAQDSGYPAFDELPVPWIDDEAYLTVASAPDYSSGVPDEVLYATGTSMCGLIDSGGTTAYLDQVAEAYDGVPNDAVSKWIVGATTFICPHNEVIFEAWVDEV